MSVGEWTWQQQVVCVGSSYHKYDQIIAVSEMVITELTLSGTTLRRNIMMQLHGSLTKTIDASLKWCVQRRVYSARKHLTSHQLCGFCYWWLVWRTIYICRNQSVVRARAQAQQFGQFFSPATNWFRCGCHWNHDWRRHSWFMIVRINFSSV